MWKIKADFKRFRLKENMEALMWMRYKFKEARPSSEFIIIKTIHIKTDEGDHVCAYQIGIKGTGLTAMVTKSEFDEYCTTRFVL